MALVAAARNNTVVLQIQACISSPAFLQGVLLQSSIFWSGQMQSQWEGKERTKSLPCSCDTCSLCLALAVPRQSSKKSHVNPKAAKPPAYLSPSSTISLVRSSLAFFLFLAPPFQDRSWLNQIEIKRLYALENGGYSPRASAFWGFFPLFYVPWFVALGRRKPSSIGALGPIWKQATWMLLQAFGLGLLLFCFAGSRMQHFWGKPVIWASLPFCNGGREKKHITLKCKLTSEC